jgi:hypothetical protein
MCYPHWYGIGDYQVFVMEISASSLYGGELATIATPAARQLNCKITRMRKRYCATLQQLMTRHKMQEKLTVTQELRHFLPDQQLSQMHNQ